MSVNVTEPTLPGSPSPRAAVGNRDKIADAALVVFVIAVFYGDVVLRMTVPLSMVLLLPVGAILLWAGRRPAISTGLVLIGALLAVPLWQLTQPEIAPRRQDLSIYLPIFYGVGTIFVTSMARISESRLWRALLAGGVMAVLAVLVTALVLPAGQFPIPGQDASALLAGAATVAGNPTLDDGGATVPAPGPFAGQIPAPGQDAGTLPAGAPTIAGNPPLDDGGTPSPAPGPSAGQIPVPGQDAGTLPAGAPTIAGNPVVDDGSAWLYAWKDNWVRSPLGRSNYLAVFFIFMLAVSLFKRSMWSWLFAFATVATLSRFGIVFLAATLLVFAGHVRGLRVSPLLGLLAGGVAAFVTVTVLFHLNWSGLPGGASLADRALLWNQAVDIVKLHPLAGVPRSYLVDTLGFSIVWHPHNLVLWAAVIFGVVGLLTYGLYLVVVARTVARRAVGSPLWTGIQVGLCICLTWSFLETISLTPAFEILVASMFGLSLGGSTTRAIAVLQPAGGNRSGSQT